ncbi:hypothetical protein Q3V23_35350 [Streptomyces sp. VNUA116]|uniref:hypothetical protein n=1 Tax=Streptomyces sp. VNUA116 TaxID=3062449 RepID=UPI002674C63A|nr:hypothetical protein [Streptomyces sp. VNUA116]WKU48920.1 hypothetical protein Q3V23_35350 [Streptomyces sp. VNUA116]
MPGRLMAPVARLVVVAGRAAGEGADGAESWRRTLAPEVTVDQGVEGLVSPPGGALPRALFATGDRVGAVLAGALRADPPPSHVLLWAGDREPEEDCGAAGRRSCPVTVLVPMGAHAARAAAHRWRGLTDGPFTVRFLPPGCPLPAACDEVSARLIKEELQVWPA